MDGERRGSGRQQLNPQQYDEKGFWTLGVDGGRWGTRHSSRPNQLQAVIDASRALLDSGGHESAKGLLRAFSSDLANGWPGDGQDLAEIRPDVGQNSSEVVE